VANPSKASYYIYENWRAHGHRVRLHRSDCSFCNSGKGIHPDAAHGNGKWLGPFESADEALSVGRSTGATTSTCHFCIP